MLARNIGPRLAVSRRARHNLKLAFPALSAADIAGIVVRMWDNLGRVAAEYPHLRQIRVFEPGGRVETHGFEHMDRAVAAGRRMIIFSGHLANWEIGMGRGPIRKPGCPDLPCRQQSAGGPHDPPISRQRRRADPERAGRGAAGDRGAAARRAPDAARRSEDE
jgi:hypothetical protein